MTDAPTQQTAPLLTLLQDEQDRRERGPACGLCARVDLPPPHPVGAPSTTGKPLQDFPVETMAWCDARRKYVTENTGRGCSWFVNKETAHG